jgi:trigger factor
MEFNVEAAGPCRKKVAVKIPKERVAEEFDTSYRNWIKSVPIPGFRPGRAPRKLVEKRFGEQVSQEVRQSLIEAAFQEALKEQKLEPIAEPELGSDELELAEEEAFEFDFTVTVKPEFDLPELKELEVEAPSAEPTQDEIDGALLELRKRKATLRPVEGEAIESGDVVSLKVRGTAGGQELLSEDQLPYEVGSSWLSGLVAEGLDDALLAKEIGATVEAKAFAPPHAENHPLAGEELDVTAEVLDMKRPDLPAFDEEFAKAYDFDTKEEMLEVVTKDVGAHKERERERLIENLALAQLMERCEFELPDELIEREAEELARRTAYELQMQKKSEEEIAQSVAEIRARRKDESALELKAYFILDKIVDEERILVTENEVREAVAQIAAYNNKAPDEMYALLRDSNRLGSLRSQLREKKARAKLRSKVKVKELKPEAKPADAKKQKKKTKKKDSP